MTRFKILTEVFKLIVSYRSAYEQTDKVLKLFLTIYNVTFEDLDAGLDDTDL